VLEEKRALEKYHDLEELTKKDFIFKKKF